jgi:hypothetical protein
MEKLQKLPSTPGIANPVGKSRRDRPKGRDEENLEKSRKRRKRETVNEAEYHDSRGEEQDSREQAPEGDERGRLLDEKA